MIESEAFVLRERGQVPKLEGIELDDSLQTGQVLLKIISTALCGTQLEQIFVSSRNWQHMPHLFGHEAHAVVVEVGDGVSTVTTGDQVIVHWRTSNAGLDSKSGGYFQSGRKLGAGKVVTMGRHTVVPERHVTKIKEGGDLLLAPFLGCSMSTAWGAVNYESSITGVTNVVILGLGGIGRLAAFFASMHKPRNLIALEASDKKLGSAITQRLTSVHSISTPVIDEVRSWDNKTSVTLIDTAGDTHLVEKFIDTLPQNSEVILVGMPSGRRRLPVDVQKLLDGLRLIGSNGGGIEPSRDIPEIATKFLGDPSLAETLRDFLEPTYFPADQLQEAIDVQQNSAKRAVIRFGDAT